MMEPFLTDLFKYQIVMKPNNIMEYTGLSTVPHQLGLADHVNHDMVIGGHHPSHNSWVQRYPHSSSRRGSGKGSYADECSRQDHLREHVQRHRLGHSWQRADVRQQRFNKLPISRDFKPGHRCFSRPGSELSWNFDTIADIRESGTQSGHKIFQLRNFEVRNVEVKMPKTTIHVTADTENVQMFMKLILSCLQLCMFLLVAQCLDDQPELSCTVTEKWRLRSSHHLTTC